MGKSTLTQFVANETNTLRAQCQFGECKIVDDSGAIGKHCFDQTSEIEFS